MAINIVVDTCADTSVDTGGERDDITIRAICTFVRALDRMTFRPSPSSLFLILTVDLFWHPKRSEVECPKRNKIFKKKAMIS